MPRFIGSTSAQVLSFCFGLFIAFLLMNYTSYTASNVPVQKSQIVQERLESDTNIPYAAQIPDQSKVYKWTGNRWEQLANFCTWMDFRDCIMLKTQKGLTPIFHHDPKNDFTSKLLIQSGVKEPETIASILEYMAGDFNITFLDVGSHVGSIALQIAKAGFRIVTVDPLQENVGRLCRSVQMGNFVDIATILFAPVSDKHNTIAFIRKWNIGETKVKVVSSDDTEHTIAAPSCDLPPLYSKTATLEDITPFIKSNKVFIKIDVESHEYFVIKGGTDFFTKREVVGIFMEWVHVKKTTEAKELISLLNQLGFTAYDLGKNGKTLKNAEFMNWPLDIIWKRTSK